MSSSHSPPGHCERGFWCARHGDVSATAAGESLHRGPEQPPVYRVMDSGLLTPRSCMHTALSCMYTPLKAFGFSYQTFHFLWHTVVNSMRPLAHTPPLCSHDHLLRQVLEAMPDLNMIIYLPTLLEGLFRTLNHHRLRTVLLMSVALRCLFVPCDLAPLNNHSRFTHVVRGCIGQQL